MKSDANKCSVLYISGGGHQLLFRSTRLLHLLSPISTYKVCSVLNRTEILNRQQSLQTLSHKEVKLKCSSIHVDNIDYFVTVMQSTIKNLRLSIIYEYCFLLQEADTNLMISSSFRPAPKLFISLRLLLHKYTLTDLLCSVIAITIFCHCLHSF